MYAFTPAAKRVAAVREAVRVLRPGGRYAAMTWDRRKANPWLGLVLDAVGEQFGVPFPPPGIQGPFSLSDSEQQELRRARQSTIRIGDAGPAAPGISRARSPRKTAAAR